MSVSYIDATVAKGIDDILMSPVTDGNIGGFSIDQLMELAGYSCACAAYDYLKHESNITANNNVLIFCGPGNNSGDGLVMARHLKNFGFQPTIVYPTIATSQTKEPYGRLVKQCQDLNINIFDAINSISIENVSLVVDALFGFSFKGPARQPFANYIATMATSKAPVMSIDIPSGWDVNNGDVHNTSFIPACVISLTLPKLCMTNYKGTHYVGGRFVPLALASQLNLILPNYEGVSQIAKLSSSGSHEEEH